MNGQFNLGSVTPPQYFLSIAVLLGLLFAMISPDDDVATPLVFLQWQLQSILPMALMVITHVIIAKSKLFSVYNPWVKLVISGVVGASLFTPFALIVDIYLGTENLPASWWQPLISEWLSVTPPVVLCWLAINAPWLMGFTVQKENTSNIQGSTEDNNKKPTENLSQANFYSLLPADKQGALIYLTAELHYLKVVTEQGSSLILYNLKDAIEELPKNMGLQTHRSYWVSQQHIVSFDKKGRQGELTLSGGHKIPVSRTNIAGVLDILNTN